MTPIPPTATVHVPVMPAEIMAGLGIEPGWTVVDGTLGGGGHAELLAAAVGPRGRLIALDLDPLALDRARERFAALPVQLVQANFRDLPEVLVGLGIDRVDAILLDLGMSSDQLADAERGFSFTSSGPLDMRFDPFSGKPAWHLVNRLSVEHLADLLFFLGEERYGRRIARAIVEARHGEPIRTAEQLADIIRRSVPRAPHERIDPATRSFQALRIAVNDELKSLEIALRRLPDCLRAQGRVAILSFHSLEDRRVKEAFRDDARYDVVTRKPLQASLAEIARNARSRSAKLRIAARAQEKK